MVEVKFAPDVFMVMIKVVVGVSLVNNVQLVILNVPDDHNLRVETNHYHVLNLVLNPQDVPSLENERSTTLLSHFVKSMNMIHHLILKDDVIIIRMFSWHRRR